MAAESAASRIRENQRRSRARRKEYVQDLEARLQRYERRGVDVTIEVQAAARRVAEQNAALKSLLNAFGMSDAKINEYLRSKESIAAPTLPGTPPVTPMPDNATTSIPRALSPASTDHHQSQFAQNIESPSVDVTPLATRCSSAHCSGTVIDTINFPECVAEFPNTVCSDRLATRWIENMTPCEEAAKIIAGMRGNCDEESVRTELGCSTNMSCMVGNMHIFQALDR